MKEEKYFRKHTHPHAHTFKQQEIPHHKQTTGRHKYTYKCMFCYKTRTIAEKIEYENKFHLNRFLLKTHTTT